MDLIIIRHGLPEREERADHEGPADPPLSPLGQRQAAAVSDYLAGEQIDHIVASSMVRAHQTAMPLAERLGLPIELRDDIREVDQHRSEYIPAEEMTLDHPMVQEFMNDPLAIFDGDYWGFRARVVGAFDALIDTHAGGNVAVFCHGMVTAVYLQVVWGLADPMQMQPDYTGITRIQAASTGHRSVRSVNETGHVRHLLEGRGFAVRS